MVAATILPAMLIAQAAWSQDKGDITISHCFTGELGFKSLQEQIAKFEAERGYKLKDSPVGHEDFKTDILVRAAGQSLPDAFSYWAGAGVQFVVDSDALRPIDDLWRTPISMTSSPSRSPTERHALHRQALPDAVQLSLCRSLL